MCKGCASKLRWLWQFCRSAAWNRPFVQCQSPRPWPSFCHVHSSLSFGVDRSTVSLLILIRGPGSADVNCGETWNNWIWSSLPLLQVFFSILLPFLGFTFHWCSLWLLQGFDLRSFSTKLTSSYWAIPFLSSFKLLSDYSTQLHTCCIQEGVPGPLRLLLKRE